jgi:aspartyl protease family protein
MRPLLVTSLLIVLVAGAAPKLFESYMDARGEASPTHPRRAEAAARPTLAPRQVELAAEADGHFYVEAEINFRPVRMMVDTGASVIALRRSDAEAAGIRPAPADFDRPVSTANGTAYAAEAALDAVRVNDIEVEDVRALVLPDEQLAVSLLGQTFLSRLARFEVSGGTLVFEN